MLSFNSLQIHNFRSPLCFEASCRIPQQIQARKSPKFVFLRLRSQMERDMKTQLEAEVEKQKIALDNSIDTVRLVLQPVRRFMAGRHIKYA